MKEYLNSLNQAQRKAVENIEGPTMVIAGAGSGKTRVLTYRIAHLMANGADSFNILALTFTNKAAREMKQRIESLMGNQAKNLWMGTFHSVFARILRIEGEKLGFPQNFTIYDTQDAQNVMKKVITDLQLDTDVYKPKNISSRISAFKNNLITVRSYFNSPELMEADAAAQRPKMGEIYKAYVEKCFKNAAMDFDDLLLRTNELLTRFPEVLAKYQDRFRYILVDEYQDTNHSQYLIVKALASRFENICVVGDDAQSIYSFRGANIQNILNFKRDYPDAKIFPLEQNYRSTQNIVNAANSIISNNKDQLDKKVWTENEVGEKLQIYRGITDTDEANFVAGKIFDLRMNQQFHLKDFAVLYRTNAQSRSLEEALRKKNIPYRVFGGLSFYQRKEIKDLIAYLRILINKNDEEALLRIINYPMRGIGETTVNKLLVAADERKVTVSELLDQIIFVGKSLGFNVSTIEKLNDFWQMIKSFQVILKNQSLAEAVIHIAKTSGLMKKLKEDDTPEGISRIENIQELINSIQEFEEEQTEIEDGNPSLENFLSNIALITDADKSTENDENKVTLMTIHLAKGLEFPNVFIVGLEENLFPSFMALNTRQELEEERRLFYVAITRAEKNCFLAYATTRFRWGKIQDCEPSRFIEEIDEKYLKELNPINAQKFVNTTGLNANIFGNFPSEKIIYEKKYPPQNLKPIQSAKAQPSIQGKAVDIKVGDIVQHDRFGKGKVIALEGEPENAKAKIQFENVGEKNLLLKFAKLKVL